jgi:hypothetical protein
MLTGRRRKPRKTFHLNSLRAAAGRYWPEQPVHGHGHRGGAPAALVGALGRFQHSVSCSPATSRTRRPNGRRVPPVPAQHLTSWRDRPAGPGRNRTAGRGPDSRPVEKSASASRPRAVRSSTPACSAASRRVAPAANARTSSSSPAGVSFCSILGLLSFALS